MVKKSKTPKTRADWVPGRGQPPKGDAVRSARLLMRVHPDLLPLVDVHARERGITRSQFVEQMLIGFLRLDPRAPKISALGQLEPPPEGVPPPSPPLRPFTFPRPTVRPNPHLFLRRWDDFRRASELVTGYRPPDSLIDDYYVPGPPPTSDEIESDSSAAAERWARSRDRR